VESELTVLFGGLVIMWSIPIASWLAIEIGLGLGLGGVFGGLYRTEAYPDADGQFHPCVDQGNPDNTPNHPAAAYCDTSVRNGGEGSYDRQERTPEPYNFNGDVPPLFFWIDVPRIAIRIKPIRQFQIRLEGGFAGYGFYFGGSLAVGF
jgi:hypothetical protein